MAESSAHGQFLLYLPGGTRFLTFQIPFVGPFNGIHDQDRKGDLRGEVEEDDVLIGTVLVELDEDHGLDAEDEYVYAEN